MKLKGGRKSVTKLSQLNHGGIRKGGGESDAASEINKAASDLAIGGFKTSSSETVTPPPKTSGG